MQTKSTHQALRAVAVAAATVVGVLAASVGGAGALTVDDAYGRTPFERSWHSGVVDYLAKACGDATCRELDAQVTVHDAARDGAACTTLQYRYGSGRWVSAGTVCDGATTVFDLKGVGAGGTEPANIRFRLRVGVPGREKSGALVLCVRNADGPEACR